MTIGIAVLALSFGVGWLSSHRAQPDPSDFLPQGARDYSDIKPKFTPEQIAWAIPLIKRNACVRAEMAVKYHLRPALVSGPTCGIDDKTEIDEDLVNVTVSGIAKIDQVEHPFTVVLEHYPPSISLTAYIILSIDVR